MLRAVLLGVLSVSAMAACKSGGDAARSQAGVAAGKVVEVSGTVTVHHGATARPLAKGETVEGDDIVETGADGNVIVELAHNLARWQLGPNKRSKVSESVAWSLPKQSGSAAQVEQDTAAAGRPAERSAAETGVSASAESAPAAAPSPAQNAPAAVAPPAAEPATKGAPPPPPAPERRERERAPAKSAAPGGRGAATEDVLDVPSGGGGGGAAVKTRGIGTAKATADVKANADVAPTAPAEGASSPDAAARALVVSNEKAIKACLTKDAQEVTVTIHVDTSGKATTIVKAKAEIPDRVRQCVINAVSKLGFAHAAANVTLDVQH